MDLAKVVDESIEEPTQTHRSPPASEPPRSRSGSPKPGPLELELNVYDFLRVCQEHEDKALPDAVLALPLDELVLSIKAELHRLREEHARQKSAKRKPEAEPEGPTRRPASGALRTRAPPGVGGRNKRFRVGEES
jgi:hypothetical protein